jgi:hypothetical protein
MQDSSDQLRQQYRSALNTEQSQSLAETNNWQQVDRDQVHRDWDALYKALALLIDTAHPGDATVQQRVAQHYQIACRFYVPSGDAYRGMALFYDENPDMKAFHNAYHPEMVAFLSQAMNIFAPNISAPA